MNRNKVKRWNMASETVQTIARLTPLAEVLALIEREVRPVAPRIVEPGAAFGTILAADVTAPTQPRAPVAILDGWALASETTLGAGGYSPVLLPAIPPRVDAGQPMPPGTDCVAPPDAVKVAGDRAEVLGTINPGDGVVPAGGDCDGKVPLRRASERLRALDVAALAAAGVRQVSARVPRLRVVAVRPDPILVGTAHLIVVDAAQCGAAPEEAGGGLSEAFADTNFDAVIAIGGTGSGRNDSSAQILDRAGRVAVHGVGLTPGETAAFGFAGSKPVLLLPGRLDAALAVWMTVGRRMMKRLTASKANDEPGQTLTLTRKISSTVGLAEFVPMRCIGDKAEPLATKYLPLSALARATGWILVPAESEGYSAGAPVQVMPWP